MNFMSDSQRKACFARLGRSMRGAERGYIPAGYRGIQTVSVDPVVGDPLIDYGSKIISNDKPSVPQDMTKGADFLLPYADDTPKYREQVTVNPYKDVSTEIDKYVAKMKAEKKPEDDIVQISDEYTFEPLKAHKGPAQRMSRLVDNRFALYVESHGKDKDGDEHLYLRSDEYPEVNVVFWPVGMDSDKAFEYVSVVPDEDLLGLNRMDIYTAAKFRKDYPGRTETSFYIPDINTRAFETPAAVINTKGGRKQAIHDVLHEVGHNIDREHTKDFLKSKDRFLANVILDASAESYVKEISPKHVMGRTTDWSDERIEFEKELARQKGITFDEALNYTGIKDEF